MKSRPRLAIVGASVRSAAFSLLRAGCDVVAADLFADADLQRACPTTRILHYPEDLAAWLIDTPSDAWFYTGALENHPELVDHMARLKPLLGNRGDVLRQVRDPLMLQKIVNAAGLNFPETKPCDGMHPGKGDWLHKTGEGGNGSGVTRACEPRGASQRSSGYWQREVSGIPGSAQYLSNGSGTCTLLGITRQLVGERWTGAAEFQYCGTIAPWIVPLAAITDLTLLGQVLSTKYHLRGLFGVDFIIDGERLLILEVNPRVTAAIEVLERATGCNLLSFHEREFKLRNVFPQAHSRYAAKAVLYAKKPLLVSQNLSAQLLVIAGSAVRPQVADIPNSSTQIETGEPILTVFSEGRDFAEVEANLRQRVASLVDLLYRDSGGS